MNRQHNLDHLRRAANGSRAPDETLSRKPTLCNDETPAIKVEITSRAQEDLAETGKDTTLEDEKTLRRRIHWSILPVMVICYFLLFTNRTNVQLIYLGTHRYDMSNEKFAYVQFCFAIAYALPEPIWNVLIGKLGPKLWLAPALLVSGFLSMVCFGVSSWGGLASVRFLIGLPLGALFPGCMYYITCWYPRRQIGLPIAIFYAGGALGAALANLINAPIVGISTLQTGDQLTKKSFGGVGSDWVVVCNDKTFFVPNFPASDDKVLGSSTGDASTTFKKWQTWYIGDDATRNTKEDYSSHAWKEAFTDTKTYLFILVHTTNVVPRDGLALVQRVTAIAFARTNAHTSKLAIYNLLYVPPVALAVITILWTSALSDRFNQRAYFMMGFSLLSITSFAILVVAGKDLETNNGERYAACFLGSVGTWTSGALSWAWIANNVEGLYKRAIVIGIIVGVGNIISGITIPLVVTLQEPHDGKIGQQPGKYTFLDRNEISSRQDGNGSSQNQTNEPTFSEVGSKYFLALICVHMASILLTRWYLNRENRRKQVNAEQLHGDTQQGVGPTEDDYGDKSTGFKYIL